MLMSVNLKRIIILHFLLLSFMTSNTQQYTNHIDSLIKIVQEHPQNSTKRIPDLLVLLKYQYLAGNKNTMFHSLNQIEDIGINNNNDNFDEYLWWKANASYLNKDNKEAREIFRQLLTDKDSQYYFKSLLKIAWTFKTKKKMSDSSLYYFSEAKNYAEKQSNEYQIAYYYLSMAKFQRNIRNTKQSMDSISKAISFFEEHDYPNELGTLYANIAHCYYIQAHYDSSVIFAEKAIPQLKTSKSYRILCSNYNVYATVLQNMGQLNKSIELYYQGFKIAEEFEIDIMTAAFLYNLGNCHLQINSYDKARTYFTECNDFAIHKKDTISHLYATNALGNIAYHQGNYDIAKSNYKQALYLSKLLDLQYIYSYFYTGLADLAIEKHDYILAQQYVDTSYFWAKPRNNVEEIIPINILQSNIYKFNGQQKKAIALLKTSLNLVRSKDYLEIETDLLSELSKVYKSVNDYKNSLYYLELAQKYTDSLNISSIMKNMVNHELEYEYEKAEKINQLEREKAEIKTQTQIKTGRLISLILAIVLLFVITISIILIFNIRTRKKRNNILRKKNRLIISQKDELTSLVTKLRTLTTELEDSNATKDKLFSIIGHDLRSPFNTICGFSQLLISNEPEKEKRHDFYQKIHNASLHLVNLVDSLLIWSRSQMGKITFQQSKFIIDEILLDTINMDKIIAEKKSINLCVDFPENHNIQVFADRNMMIIILQNLIGNALKYTPNNGKVCVGYHIMESKINVFVKDSGIGMTKDELAYLYNSLIITSKNGTNGEKGTGLGLNICKDFIAKHGGTLIIKSEPGQGSEFSFEIPIS